MPFFAGLDGGSVSVKLAVVNDRGELVAGRYVRHRGRPLETARVLLEEALAAWPDLALLVTGSTGRLAARRLDVPQANELAACAAAVRALHPEVRTVIELGGEDAKLLLLNDQGVRDFALNSVCAAGTGSFLDQQAERMGLAIEDFAAAALRAEAAPPIAGRCSVFAKSDMIHLQQIATPRSDIAAGLCLAVARNFLGSVARGRDMAAPVAFMGGVALNRGVVRAFETVLGQALGEDRLGRLVIPEWTALMPAVGAALLGRAEGLAARLAPAALARLDEIQAQDRADADGEPLLAGNDSFRRRHLERGEDPVRPPEPGAAPVDAWLGVDIGSISTNLALIDAAGNLLAKRYLRTASRPIEAVQQGLAELAEELGGRVTVRGVGTTGSGRYMIADFIQADVVKNEITAQAMAAAFIDPAVDTIFEIGGQDSKYISLKDGVIADFEMNKACAAGTGSFLEEQAEKLDVSVKGEFSALALDAAAPCRLGERCTVFMENSLMSELGRGASKSDLLAGLARSIVENYLNRVVAGRPVGRNIFFQGGTAFNKAVVAAFEQRLGRPVVIPPHHDVTGAIGMALIARDHMRAHPELATAFPGLTGERLPYAVKSFQCRSCDNRCEINRVTIDAAGRHDRLFYGGRCEKYDRRRLPQEQGTDLFAARDKALARAHDARRAALAASGGAAPRGRLGLPRVFQMQTLLPFFSTLLWELGFEPVLSPGANRRIIHQGAHLVLADACFPIKAAHGHVQNLLDEGVTALFLPSIVNMNDPAGAYSAGSPCPLTQSFPYQAAVAFQGALAGGVRLIAPTVDFRRGPDSLALEIERGLRPLGVRLPEVRRALKAAGAAQAEFRRAVRTLGEAALAEIEDRGERALVILGRAYNAFDMGMNLEIPRKLAGLGVRSLPMDMLPATDDCAEIEDDWPGMYWHSGQRILQAARFVRSHPLLSPLFIGNFSCGPDSFILKFLDRELAGEPCLHVEIDEHSADAGVVTRCEAFLDSLDMRGRLAPPQEAPVERRAGVRALASGNGHVRRRVVYIPAMCDHAEGLAAALRASGVDSQVLPETDARSAALGRQYCSGKECYPFVLTTGDMLRQVFEPGFEPARSAFFMPGGEGPCRFGQYNLAQRLILDDLGLQEVPIVSPQQDETLYRQMGMVGKLFPRRSWEGVAAFDLLTKCVHRVRPYEKVPGSADELHGLYKDKLAAALERSDRAAIPRLLAVLADMRADFEHLPRHSGRKPVIGVVGEIYVRSNRFANEQLARQVEALGGEVRLAPIDEWIYYVNRLGIQDAWQGGLYKTWGALALRDHFQRRIAARFERLFAGFLDALGEPPAARVMAAAAPYVAESFRGEAILSVGKALELIDHEVRGVINAMPFGCMPGTVAAAILRGVSRDRNIPVISIPFDGTPSAVTALQLEAFMAQAGAC